MAAITFSICWRGGQKMDDAICTITSTLHGCNSTPSSWISFCRLAAIWSWGYFIGFPNWCQFPFSFPKITVASCSLPVHPYSVDNKDGERKADRNSRQTLCCSPSVNVCRDPTMTVLCCVYVRIMSHQWLAKLMWSAVERQILSGKESTQGGGGRGATSLHRL